ncbi:MAG: histidine kinase dimerization/phosphoacceptor domain -containing protein [Treponemataceae bacterium]
MSFGQKKSKRLGVSEKLFLGFSFAALLPIAVALITSVSVYLSQSKIVSREAVREKARSASLLFAERADRLIGVLDNASKENTTVYNLELGLDLALENHLSTLSRNEGLAGLWVKDPQGVTVAADLNKGSETGFSPPASRDAGHKLTLTHNDKTPVLIDERSILSGAGSILGSLNGALDLRHLAAKTASELEAPVFILTPTGESMTVMFPNGSESQKIELPSDWLMHASGNTKEPFIGKIGSSQYFLGTMPFVDVNGRMLAWIGIGYPVKTLTETRDAGLLTLLLAGLVAVGISAIAGLYFSRTIARPLKALAAATREISAGKFGITTDIVLDDEIGDLAREFDSMSRTLSEQEEERAAAEESLRQSEIQFRSIFDGVYEAILIMDNRDGTIIDSNFASEELLGFMKHELLGKRFIMLSVTEEGYDERAGANLIIRAKRGERIRTEWKVRRKDGSTVWVEIFVNDVRLGGENRILVSCRDISERKTVETANAKSLNEKATLLKEIHHRVKNNFQIINSLFDLQAAATEDRTLQSILREPRARIQAMAMVHEQLYQSDDLTSIDFGQYVDELARELFIAYQVDPARVSLEINAESIEIGIDKAIPCGLILNELVTNAIKYAFPASSGRGGKIHISLRKEENEIVLLVHDDGVGISEEVLANRSDSLGLTLVDILAQQLYGKVHIDGSNGTKAEVRFE